MAVRDVEVDFTVHDGAYIAYEVFGVGPVDLVVEPGITFPIDLMWELPQLAEFMDSLAQIARVIAYDGRGLGASDPLSPTDPAATLETQAADLLAVLDAVGSKQASILSFSAQADLVIAATYPERVRSLIIDNLRPSYPELRGRTFEERKAFARWLGSTRGLRAYNPRVAHDPVLRQWWSRAHRLVCSPEQLAQHMEYAAQIELVSFLEQVHTPTLVFHRRENRIWDIETSRRTAERLPNGRFIELEGSESDLFVGDTAPVIAEITKFLRDPQVNVDHDDRQLATVLFTDIVQSTERLAEIGDQAWRSILDLHDRTIGALVAEHRGQVIRGLGDGVLATFDGPARAVRCASAIREALAATGIAMRAGLHTGEIDLRGDDIAGLAVHTAARVSALAGAGEVLVSSTVKDLVAGSGIHFEERGQHELKGVPGTWKLFALAD